MIIKNIEDIDLIILIKLLKSEGVVSFSYGNLKIELEKSSINQQDISGIEVEGDKDPSDEDLLFWSSGK